MILYNIQRGLLAFHSSREPYAVFGFERLLFGGVSSLTALPYIHTRSQAQHREEMGRCVVALFCWFCLLVGWPQRGGRGRVRVGFGLDVS